MSTPGSLDSPDSLGLWQAASGLPEELPGLLDAAARAFDASHSATRGPLAGGASQDLRVVAAFGQGTDGVAASAAAALGQRDLAVPFWIGRDASVPRFVDEHALCFALCGDGETAETIEAASEAAARGALIVAVGGDEGSSLAALADEVGFAWCPLGAPGPRTIGSLAATVVAVLAALARAGLMPDPALSVTAAAANLARRREGFVARDGVAPELARRLGRTIPLVYGAEGVGGVAARWWKTRVNLNAKAPAFCGTIPPASYDEVAGWGQGGDITRQVVSLVLLRHQGEPPGAAPLFAGVRLASDEVMAEVLEVHASGKDDLACLLDLALLGELVSLYLARGEGVDPGPVPAVEAVHPRPSGRAESNRIRT